MTTHVKIFNEGPSKIKVVLKYIFDSGNRHQDDFVLDKNQELRETVYKNKEILIQEIPD